MTNTSQDKQPDSGSQEEVSVPATVPPSPAGKPVKPSKSWSLVALGASALSLAALAAAGLLWYQTELHRTQIAASRADISGTTRQMETQDLQLREMQRQLDRERDEDQRAREALQDEIDQLKSRLDSQQKRLQALSTTDRADWLLAEAEYLIRLANQRLLMGKEIGGAYDLLKSADTILVELDDYGLYPVRKALAEDMARLRAAGRIDIEGVYLRLAAAAKQGDQLRLFELPVFEAQEQQESAEPQNITERIQSGFKNALEKLKGYVRLTPRDQPYKPLLAPEHAAAVRQNLHLMFEQAQMAALAGKQSLYQSSLEKARYWLQHYYTLDTDATQALLSTIDELLGEKVAVELPDISGSERALKDYVESLHDVKPTPPGNEPSAVSGSEPSASSGSEPSAVSDKESSAENAATEVSATESEAASKPESTSTGDEGVSL